MKQRTVDAARGRWVGILSSLGVGDNFLRNRHGPCPFCGGKDRYRFDDKDGNGTWFCSACGHGRGIEFLMRFKACDFKAACALIDPLVGSAKMETRREKTDPRPRLRKVWSESVPHEDGDAVAQYLRGRGLDVGGSLRTHSGIAYFDNGQRSGVYPAMVAMMQDKNGEAKSLHITYLSGAGKASVPSPRKILPPVGKLAGSAIRLVPVDDTLAIAEGIETARAYTQLTGVPCWAATNATLLGQFEPPEGITRVIVAGDNDANFTGQYSAYMLAHRLSLAGIACEVDLPYRAGTDWLDVLNAKSAAVTTR